MHPPTSSPSDVGATIDRAIDAGWVPPVDRARAKAVAYIGGAFGLALLTTLVAYEGFGDVANAVADAGIGLAVITVFHLTTILAHAIAWRDLLAPVRARVRTLFWARWVAESINDLLPVLQLGGNIVRARVLARTGVEGTRAGATVVVDVTTNLLAQVLFTAIGVVLLLVHLGGGKLTGPVLLGLALMGAALVGLYVIQRRGVFSLGARLVNRVAHASAWRSLVSSAALLDEDVRRLHAVPRPLAQATMWHLAGWLLGSVEAWLALRFLGHPVSLTVAVLLESVAEAVRTAAFAVPAALGVQEGGYVVLGRVLGLPTDVALALSLTKRVRELLLGVPGLIAWQADEIGRRLEKRAAARATVVRPDQRVQPLVERIGLPSLDEGSLLAAAQRHVRADDFGGNEFREPLRRLLRSIEDDSQLTLVGRFAARADLLRMLNNRLELQRDRIRYPEIAAQSIVRPLFITGLPRSGSTLLHGLLAQDPTHRVPYNWETMYPSPPPQREGHDNDPRIATAARQIRWFHFMAPEFPKIHPVGARLPEECVVILSQSFLSFQFSSSYFVPTYQAWLEQQDLRPAYRAHRQFLQQLQWRYACDRWVLKAPPHLPGLQALFAIYPDAQVIMTHRDPLEVVASVASLHAVLRRTFSKSVDPLRVGPEVSAMLADDIRRGLAARDGGCAPPERFLDIVYTDLVRDPLATVRHIYTHFGLPLSAAAETRMREFLAQNPQDKHGRHEYTLAQFGLDADTERARYRAYRERFGL